MNDVRSVGPPPLASAYLDFEQIPENNTSMRISFGKLVKLKKNADGSVPSRRGSSEHARRITKLASFRSELIRHRNMLLWQNRKNYKAYTRKVNFDSNELERVKNSTYGKKYATNRWGSVVLSDKEIAARFFVEADKRLNCVNTNVRLAVLDDLAVIDDYIERYKKVDRSVPLGGIQGNESRFFTDASQIPKSDSYRRSTYVGPPILRPVLNMLPTSACANEEIDELIGLQSYERQMTAFDNKQYNRTSLRIGEDVRCGGSCDSNGNKKVFSSTSYDNVPIYLLPSRYVGKNTKIMIQARNGNSKSKLITNENGNAMVLRLRNRLLKRLYRNGVDLTADTGQSFLVVPGLTGEASTFSFQSTSNSNLYLRHRNFVMRCESGSGDLFQKDATFRVVGRKMFSVNYPNHFIETRGEKLLITTTSKAGETNFFVFRPVRRFPKFVKHKGPLKIRIPVQIFQHHNFTGKRTDLGVGRYDVNALIAKGAKNDDISSLVVARGYRAVLYIDWNLRGKSAIFTEGRYRLADMEKMGIRNDSVSSIAVEVDTPQIVKTNIAVSGEESFVVAAHVDYHQKNGYSKNFIGIEAGDAKSLKPGDKFCLKGEEFVVDYKSTRAVNGVIVVNIKSELLSKNVTAMPGDVARSGGLCRRN